MNICAAHDKKQGTFYQVAKKNKIPEWIISLRHDAAHSQNLPTEDILDTALIFFLDWLYKNYWYPVSLQMNDYIIIDQGINLESIELKIKLEPLVTNYTYVNLSLHPYWNYTTISCIKNEEVRESLKSDIESLLETENIHIDTYTKLSSILNKLWQKIETILNNYDSNYSQYAVPELLIEGDIFLCNVEQHSEIFGGK